MALGIHVKSDLVFFFWKWYSTNVYIQVNKVKPPKKWYHADDWHADRPEELQLLGGHVHQCRQQGGPDHHWAVGCNKSIDL